MSPGEQLCRAALQGWGAKSLLSGERELSHGVERS